MLRRLVIFSVGNPGRMNRHSAGHYMLGKLCEANEMATEGHQSALYQSKESEDISLVKSLVFMNQSGRALGQYIKDRPLNDAALVILYDDFEIDSGKVKISPMKSKESHNGLSSCFKKLEQLGVGQKRVFKLGIGIGPKPKNTTSNEMASWVLSKFEKSELAKINATAINMSNDYLQEVSKGMEAETTSTSRWNKIFAKKFQRGEYNSTI